MDLGTETGSDDKEAITASTANVNGTPARGVKLSQKAYDRFARLNDRLKLLMMDTIDEYLEEKSSLSSTYFNLLALKDSQATSKLNRSASLLAKLSVFFLPISFMTSYFSVEIPELVCVSPPRTANVSCTEEEEKAYHFFKMSKCQMNADPDFPFLERDLDWQDVLDQLRRDSHAVIHEPLLLQPAADDRLGRAGREAEQHAERHVEDDEDNGEWSRAEEERARGRRGE